MAPALVDDAIHRPDARSSMPPGETSAHVAVPAAQARNPGIDLLRGLAILLVVLQHLRLRVPLKKTALADVLPPWLLRGLHYSGSEAVFVFFVFFVISGLLIADNALHRWGSLERIDGRVFQNALANQQRQSLGACRPWRGWAGCVRRDA